jgi:hypothetical protein
VQEFEHYLALLGKSSLFGFHFRKNNRQGVRLKTTASLGAAAAMIKKIQHNV